MDDNSQQSQGPQSPREISDSSDRSDLSSSDIQVSQQMIEERTNRLTQAMGIIWPTLAQLQVLQQNNYGNLLQLHGALDEIDRSYKEKEKNLCQILCIPSCTLDSHNLIADWGRKVHEKRDAVLNHHEVSIAAGLHILPEHSSSLPKVGGVELTLYLPLDVTKSEIRLLRLLPGGKSAEICCEMFKVSMDEKLEYFALSYTWGDESITSTISVNGLEVSITRNLEVALRNLRQEHDPIIIWIDALCINQKDSAEKGRQIMRMWDVYAQAQSTLIWLGESADDSDRAMDFIRILSDSDPNDPDLRLDSATWTAVETLLERPWWSRVWIIQEVFASTNAIVKCGSKEAHFDAFRAIMKANFPYVYPEQGTNSKEGVGVTLIPTNALLCMLYDLEDAPEEVRSLEPWLNRAQEFKSSEPRDKIYALLGFASAKEKELIRPDYTKPLHQIQLELVARLLTEGNQLLILQRGKDHNSASLASWVRLGCPEQSYLPMIFPATGRTPFSASGTSKVRLGFTFSKNQLNLCGLVFDTISFVSPRVMPVRCDEPMRDTIWPLTCAIWKRCAEMFQPRSGNPYAKSCGVTEAFWRTLILDRYSDWSGPPPSEFGQCFEVWRGNAQVPEEYVRSCGTVSSEEIRSRYTRDFRNAIFAHLAGRSFFVTNKGFMGLVATVDGAEEGDAVCLLAGGEVPFILRNKEDRLYELIGESYVHGIMDGSAWDNRQPLDVSATGREDGLDNFYIC